MIGEMTTFNDILNCPFNGRKLIAHCYDLPKEPLAQLYQKGENALILIGPEGDFSQAEVETAIAANFQPVTLATSRLRTETACLIATNTAHVINNLS